MADKGKLVIVGTPIGNLGDLSLRAGEALKTCDAVYAEDTRVTAKLLAYLEVKKPLYRLDEAMMEVKAEAVLERVASGETITYCSDAGMPGVSDPGMRLISAAYDAGMTVEIIPGPTAVATAFVASGFSARSFYFGGFFPRKEGERDALLKALKTLDAALVFYESPRRIVSALRSVARLYPCRRVCVCRELTKLHEERLLDDAASLAVTLEERDSRGELRGEMVMVIDAPSDEEEFMAKQDAADFALVAAQALAHEGLRTKDITKKLIDEFGLSRNAAYEIAAKAVKEQ